MHKRIGSAGAAVLALGLVATAAAQEANVEEIVAYQAFYQASQGSDALQALEAARDYVKRFPQGPNAGSVQTWLAQAEPQLRGAAFNKALQQGDVAGMIRLGREQLAEQPDDLTYLLSLAVNLRQQVLLGSKEEPAFEAAAAEFSKKAAQLIETGAVPPGAAGWRKDTTLAVLQQNLAIVAQRQGRDDEALALHERALALAPEVSAVAGYSGFYCGKLRKLKYDEAVASYQALPEEQRRAPEPGPEVRAALDQVDAQADATIACWAAFVGATQKSNPFGEVRATIEQALKALYASRRPDDPAGLEALVAKYTPR